MSNPECGLLVVAWMASTVKEKAAELHLKQEKTG
jgi:hypothetical protein